MKKHKTTIILILGTITFSLVIYSIQIFIFNDPSTTFFYLLQDLAFVPISVAIVALVFDRLLKNREKLQKIKHNNVLISTFFVELGTDMIIELSKFNSNLLGVQETITTNSLSSKNISETKKMMNKYTYLVDSRSSDLEILKVFINQKRSLMLDIMASTTLLEHDTFTDMLWAIFHVADELQSRQVLNSLPKSDLDHLSIDFQRAYKLLILEWFDYIKYLNREYPFLYSLAIRKNPFNDSIDVRIQDTIK